MLKFNRKNVYIAYFNIEQVCLWQLQILESVPVDSGLIKVNKKDSKTTPTGVALGSLWLTWKRYSPTRVPFSDLLKI